VNEVISRINSQYDMITAWILPHDLLALGFGGGSKRGKTLYRKGSIYKRQIVDTCRPNTVKLLSDPVSCQVT